MNGFVKFLHEARFGAYTALWAGLSSGVDVKVGSGYVIPWGGCTMPRDRIFWMR